MSFSHPTPAGYIILLEIIYFFNITLSISYLMHSDGGDIFLERPSEATMCLVYSFKMAATNVIRQMSKYRNVLIKEIGGSGWLG